LEERARVDVAPVELAMGRVQPPIDLVFADPPYADATLLERTVELLARPGLLLETSVVVLEQSAASEPPTTVGPLPLGRTRRHGRTRVSLYASGAEGGGAPGAD
jgi:16S rRNA G966 N2-methylase RsmD